MVAIRYDRRIQFFRKAKLDNGFTSAAGDFAAFGDELWGAKDAIKDAERYAAMQASAQVTARFVVPYTAFAASITRGDRLQCEGDTFDITGIKEIGRRARLEITGGAVVS